MKTSRSQRKEQKKDRVTTKVRQKKSATTHTQPPDQGRPQATTRQQTADDKPPSVEPNSRWYIHSTCFFRHLARSSRCLARTKTDCSCTENAMTSWNECTMGTWAKGSPTRLRLLCAADHKATRDIAFWEMPHVHPRLRTLVTFHSSSN